jgi:hypothetical protein
VLSLFATVGEGVWSDVSDPSTQAVGGVVSPAIVSKGLVVDAALAASSFIDSRLQRVCVAGGV